MTKVKSTLIKSNSDLKSIREACAISSQLHLIAMSTKSEGLSELNLKAEIHQFHKADKWAYPTIIGSGRRATILHAKPTARKIRNDELILIDMGVHHNGFASDITRTWTAGAKFSREQKTIYEIVLKAQTEVIKRVKPGTNLQELHQISKNYLLDGILSKGVIRSGKIEKYFPHKTSHWIGHHVHDQCPYFYKNENPIELAAGMVFTIEPGLYFKKINSAYSNIGVRIEDVILVTESGYEVLTHVPKEIEEIEAIWIIARNGSHPVAKVGST